MMPVSDRVFDVAIVGAGAAGAALAAVLGRTGARVALIDRKDPYPRCFKAEKVEPEQADLLRAMGLFEGVRPVLTPTSIVATGWRGRVLNRVSMEQYGVDFWALANALRAQLPEAVSFLLKRVVSIDLEAGTRRVVFDDGAAIEARLIVLSSGVSPRLFSELGVMPRMIRNPHSMCFGFDVELGTTSQGAVPTDEGREAFGFDSLTYYSESVDTRVDFITLFPVEDRWRANLFAYFEPRSASTKLLTREPEKLLSQAFPRIDRLIGKMRPTTRVESAVIDLYTVPGPVREGLLLLGDSNQSVCPATGTGLSKVLTDVLVASEWIPRWLERDDFGLQALRAYHEDARKTGSDGQSLEWAEYRRDVSTETSWRWKLHRVRSYAQMAMHRTRHIDAAQD